MMKTERGIDGIERRKESRRTCVRREERGESVVTVLVVAVVVS